MVLPGMVRRVTSPDSLFDLVILGIILLASAVVLWAVLVEGALLSLVVA